MTSTAQRKTKTKVNVTLLTERDCLNLLSGMAGTLIQLSGDSEQVRKALVTLTDAVNWDYLVERVTEGLKPH